MDGSHEVALAAAAVAQTVENAATPLPSAEGSAEDLAQSTDGDALVLPMVEQPGAAGGSTSTTDVNVADTARTWALDAIKGELDTMEARKGTACRKRLAEAVTADEVAYAMDRTLTASGLGFEVTRLDKIRVKFERAEREEFKRLSNGPAAPAGVPVPVPTETKHFLDLEAQERLTEQARCWPVAQSLAQAPNILDRAVSDLRAVGVIGEERVVRAVLLAGVARLTSKPVSITVKGASASGKSYTVRSTLGLLPPDAVFSMTASAERALIYLSPGSLRHRLMYLAEATAIQQDDHSILALTIRALQSEGEIRYPVTIKEGDELITREVHQEGPTGLIVTTTAQALHAENETRQLTIDTDDTQKQTRSVVVSIAQRDRTPPLDTAAWHALFRWIECGQLAVVVPFAGWVALHVNVGAVRMRRDFDQMLSLTKASAILHQATRQRDGQGRIVAESQDYGTAVLLIAATVDDATGVTVAPHLRNVWQAVRDCVEDVLKARHEKDLKPTTDADRLAERVTMSARQLAGVIRRDRAVANRNLHAAIKAGLLVAETRRNEATRVGLAVLNLPATGGAGQAVFPPVSAITAARQEWSAAAAAGNKLLSGGPLPLEYDPDSPF
jgi:hypothetical protein